MIKNNILINTETRNIKKRDYDFLGVAGENNIEQLVFKLTAFINGTATVEYQKDDGTKDFTTLPDPTNETYILDIKNELLRDTSKLYMQLHITTANVEVFKSKIFKMNIYEQIGATTEAPEEYEEWIDVANGKIAQMTALENSIKEAEKQRNQAVNNAISNIQDLTEDYNKNAQEKTEEFNTNVTNKTNDFDTNAKNKTTDFNNNAEEKTEVLNNIADGVKNMATAITLPQFYVDDEMNIHGVTATKLSNIDLYYDDETGDFKEGVVENG